MKKYLLSMLTLLCTCSLVAQEAEETSSWQCDTPHSLSLNIGSYPLGWDTDDLTYIEFDATNRFSSYDKYTPSKLKLPSFDVTYNYRFNKRFSLSATLAYSGSSCKYYDLYTDKFLYNLQFHAITLMPVANYHWYTSASQLVTLYSSLGMGVTYLIENNADHYVGRTKTTSHFAGQLTYFGISVGRSVYGIGELSVGSLGVSRIGIGYKF